MRALPNRCPSLPCGHPPLPAIQARSVSSASARLERVRESAAPLPPLGHRLEKLHRDRAGASRACARTRAREARRAETGRKRAKERRLNTSTCAIGASGAAHTARREQRKCCPHHPSAGQRSAA
eukprot:859036-Pleurochrysis_carterae.AAC.4